MQQLVVNVCPSLICNNHCKYCYISNADRSNLRPMLDLEILEQRLRELTTQYEIPKVNLYGGEITLLPADYLRDLRDVILRRVPEIWLTTNLSNPSRLELFSDSYVSTSLNPDRADYGYLQTIIPEILASKTLKKPLGALTVVTRTVADTNPREIIDVGVELGLASLNFIRYYPSITTGDVEKVSLVEYQEYVARAIKEYELLPDYIKKRFLLANKDMVDQCINRQSIPPTMDSFIFIMPNGNYATLAYTNDGLEYFKNIDNLEHFRLLCTQERKEYAKKCGLCEFYGFCYTEHLTGEPCPGCKDLLRSREKHLSKN